MTRRTQTILFHLLPVAFWLLAIGVCLLTNYQSPITNHQSPNSFHFSVFTFHLSILPALLSVLSCAIVRRIKRHSDPTGQCFLVGLLLGIAAYWLPFVLVLFLPIWGYLIYRNLFSLRAFLASLIGLATVAIWVFVLVQLSTINYQLSTINYHLSNDQRLIATTLSFLLAWLGTVIVRDKLRPR